MKKIIFFLLLVNICNAQILREKKVTYLNKIYSYEDKVDNIFNDNDKFYYSILKAERYNPKTYSIDRIFSLRTTKGSEFNLAQNEYPLNIINGIYYTFKEDVKNNTREFITYNFTNGIIKKRASKILSLSSTINVLKSGDIIFTEGGHSGRDWIGLYSKDFKKIHEFKPFNDESNILQDSNENYISYAGQIGTDTKIRVALYGSFDSNGLIGTKEINIDSGYILSSLKIVNQKIALLLSSIRDGSSKIIILDNNLIQKAEFTLSERVAFNKLVGVGNKLFTNTRSSIICFDLENLKKIWEFKKESNNLTKTKIGFKFIGNNIYALDETHIIILQGIYEDGVDSIKEVELKVLNIEKGKIIQQLKTNMDFKGDLKFKKINKDIYVYSNDNIKVYEKH